MLAVAAIVAVAVVVADCGLVPGHTYCLSYCRGANNRGYRNRSTWLGKKTKCGTMGKQRKTMTPVPGSLSLSLSLSLDRRKDRGAMPLVKKSRTRAQRQREGGHSLCFSSARSSLNEWTWAWEAPPPPHVSNATGRAPFQVASSQGASGPSDQTGRAATVGMTGVNGGGHGQGMGRPGSWTRPLFRSLVRRSSASEATTIHAAIHGFPVPSRQTDRDWMAVGSPFVQMVIAPYTHSRSCGRTLRNIFAASRAVTRCALPPALCLAGHSCHWPASRVHARGFVGEER